MALESVTPIVAEAIRSAFDLDPDQLERVPLDVSQDPQHGDLTVSAFALARPLRQAPPKIAARLAEALQGAKGLRQVEAVAGYVNLRLDPELLFGPTLRAHLEHPERCGRGEALAGRRMLVEFSAPNTNKPLHLGHLRNNFLGDAMTRILAHAGAEVVRTNLLNDRGIHICKSMLAYRRFGEGATPASLQLKGDHLVGHFYVVFEQRFREERDAWVEAHPEHYEAFKEAHATDRKGRPVPEEKIRSQYLAAFKDRYFGEVPLGAACQAMLREWEAGVPEVVALWEQMNAWAIEGFTRTYERTGIRFDAIYRESETWQLGKEIVLEGLKAGHFTRRDDGAVVCDLSEETLGEKVLLRSDGTSIYITQDLGTTTLKAERHEVDAQIWVVADEQEYHFKVLFALLKRLGYSWADDLFHLAYGLVHLPEGRMKSREGKVVDADDLVDEVAALAAQEIRERYEKDALDDEEVARRGEVIALAALRFMLLKISPKQTMIFNPEESVRFDGDTGSRILYAYARLAAMIRQGQAELGAEFDPAALGDEAERVLMLQLLSFPTACARAASEHNPSAIANALLALARELNRFYERCPVLKEEDPAKRKARLLLCNAAAVTLKKGCELLGIEVLEQM